MTVAVTRRELSAGDLRREAKRCRDAAASRRMPALALVLEGSSRGEAARHAGMDRQTLRDRVHRYNAVYGRSPCMDGPRSARAFSANHGRPVRTAPVYPASVGPSAAGLDG
jgi:hypothetical protein